MTLGNGWWSRNRRTHRSRRHPGRRQVGIASRMVRGHDPLRTGVSSVDVTAASTPGGGVGCAGSEPDRGNESHKRNRGFTTRTKAKDALHSDSKGKKLFTRIMMPTITLRVNETASFQRLRLPTASASVTIESNDDSPRPRTRTYLAHASSRRVRSPTSRMGGLFISRVSTNPRKDKR